MCVREERHDSIGYMAGFCMSEQPGMTYPQNQTYTSMRMRLVYRFYREAFCWPAS